MNPNPVSSTAPAAAAPVAPHTDPAALTAALQAGESVPDAERVIDAAPVPPQAPPPAAPAIAAAASAGGMRFGQDLRQERRVPLQFRTALVYHQHADAASRPTFHGVSHDMSRDGLTLIVDRNVFTPDEVTVLIALPAAHVGAGQKIVEATATMVHTVYTSEYMAWRIGLNFVSFKRDGERRLREAIAAFDSFFVGA